MQTYPIPGFTEPFGSITHLLGALTFAGLSFFLLRRGRGEAGRVLVLAIFSFSCVLLLSISGVYHMLQEGGAGRAVLGRLDLGAIFVLIAGTHTPLQAFFFRGAARWGVLVAMWVLTATGITLFSVFYESMPTGLGTSIYLLLGWIAGSAGLVAWRRHGTKEVKLLIAGGLSYSIGAILMGIGWPTIIPGVIGPHEVWHVAVLVAMGLHWTFMFRHAQWSLSGPVSP